MKQTLDLWKCRRLISCFCSGCSRAELQSALLVLIQHNCIQPYVLEQDEGSKAAPQTVFQPDLSSILHRLRYQLDSAAIFRGCHAHLAVSCSFACVISSSYMGWLSVVLSPLGDLACCVCPCFLDSCVARHKLHVTEKRRDHALQG